MSVSMGKSYLRRLLREDNSAVVSVFIIKVLLDSGDEGISDERVEVWQG